MNEFESDWISLSQINMAKMAKFKDHQVKWLSEFEWEVNLREDNKVSESNMAVSESKMAEFKMAAIIKLSQNEQVKFFFLCK